MHKYKEKAIEDVLEQIKIGYRAIVVARKDYERWGSDLDKLIKSPYRLVNECYVKQQIVIGWKITNEVL